MWHSMKTHGGLGGMGWASLVLRSSRPQYMSHSGLQPDAGTRRSAQAREISLPRSLQSIHLAAPLGHPVQRLPEGPNPMIFRDRPRPDGPLAALPRLAAEWLRRRWGPLLRSVTPRSNTACIVAGLVTVSSAVAQPGAAPQGSSVVDLEGMKSQLEARGWSVKRTQGGDLELRPPEASPSTTVKTATTTPPVDTESTVPADVRVDLSNLGSMQSALRKRGWEVQEETDGSLVLKPYTKEKPRSMKKGEGLSDLGLLLQAAGWRVKTASDGALFLFPKQNVQAPKPEVIEVPLGDLGKIESALAVAGWRVHRDSGHLVVLPAAAGGRVTGPSVHADAELEKMAVSVVLPVDTKREARRIASAWIRASSDEHLLVGKVRKLRWVYVVSIVEQAPPYRLRRQIAIRTKDGKVVPLF